MKYAQIIDFRRISHTVNNVTDVYLSIDTVDFSVQHGEWTPMTDSSFEAIDNIEDKRVLWSI